MKKKVLRSFIVMMIAVLVVSMMPVTASAATKKPGQVKITSFKVSAVSKATNKCTVTIKWKKAKNAKGYVVYAKHGDGKWKMQKKCGKYIRTFKLKGVPAGQFAIKVKAVNKKKSGKFSKVKSKYIASPLTLQQYVDRIEPEAKQDGVSFEGNKMVFIYDDIGCYLDDSLKAQINSSLDGFKSDAASIKKDFKVNCGLKNISIIFRYIDLGGTIFERQF